MIVDCVVFVCVEFVVYEVGGVVCDVYEVVVCVGLCVYVGDGGLE